MARRRSGWKRGDWLVKDEESGFTEYGSRVAYDYYGTLKLKKEGDRAHPQDFVRALDDPHSPYPQGRGRPQYDTCTGIQGFFVGTTSVSAPEGPATHLFRPAIPEQEVECTNWIY